MTGNLDQGAAGVLNGLLAHGTIPAQAETRVLEGLAVPALTTTPPPDPRIRACNTACQRLCGYAWDEMVGHSPRMLQGPATEPDAARAFSEGLRERGEAATTLVNYRKDGDAYHVTLYGARLNAQEDGEPIFVALQEPVTAEDAGGPGSDTLAHDVERVMRRVTQASYRAGMPPSQWSALRYFAESPAEQRTLTTFARRHRVTMGTASSTISALVKKGYLVKRGFRGPIDVTDSGRDMLARDPINQVREAVGAVPPERRAEAEAFLQQLCRRFDESLDG